MKKRKTELLTIVSDKASLVDVLYDNAKPEDMYSHIHIMPEVWSQKASQFLRAIGDLCDTFVNGMSAVYNEGVLTVTWKRSAAPNEDELEVQCIHKLYNIIRFLAQQADVPCTACECGDRPKDLPTLEKKDPKHNPVNVTKH